MREPDNTARHIPKEQGELRDSWMARLRSQSMMITDRPVGSLKHDYQGSLSAQPLSQSDVDNRAERQQFVVLLKTGQ